MTCAFLPDQNARMKYCRGRLRHDLFRMTADIDLRDVSHWYPGSASPTVDHITLAIPQGRTTVLVGPSGCGKTTILKLIAGLQVPGQGVVRFDPRQPPGFAYVFQSPALLPWATVAENVALPLQLGGVPDASRVTEALTAVGLADKLGSRPHALSGGQQMRVSLARALVSGASRILLDEPFAALDEITRQNLVDLIDRLRVDRHLTIVLVTHNVAEAVFLGNQVALMVPNPGRILHVLKIDGPSRRDSQFRSDPIYHSQCADVSALLHQAAEAVA
jgi:NitT/TauT family transport system ATP-binding protein